MDKLLATTVHPNGQRVDYYQNKPEKMRQHWAERNGRISQDVILPPWMLRGLLMDIERIGGQVRDYQ